MKWAPTEYIDVETGEILKSKDVKNMAYIVVEEKRTKQQFYYNWYNKITKYIKITAKQQELWNS